MGYDVYLGNCLLPITPEKITTKINGNNKTVTLINDGEINILKKPGLTDIEFTAMIPQVKYPYAVYKDGFIDAGYYFNVLEGLKNSLKPFQFIVCRRTPIGKQLLNTNIKVSLEEYKISEDVKLGFDFEVKISLKQFKEYGTKQINVQIASGKPKASVEPNRETNNSPASTSAQTHIVKSGECLCAIAKYYYGSESKYIDIYNANRAVIGGNPSLIMSGQALTIPAV